MAQLRYKKTTPKPLGFKTRASSFVLRAIKLRRKLLREVKNRRAVEIIEKDISYLEAWFSNPLTTVSAAKLIVRQYDKIYIILPGEGAKNHKSMIMELENLRFEAGEILQKEEVPNPKLLV